MRRQGECSFCRHARLSAARHAACCSLWHTRRRHLGVKVCGCRCTTQMVALTMMALALSEDSIRLRARRNDIIDALGSLPDQIREARFFL